MSRSEEDSPLQHPRTPEMIRKIQQRTINNIPQIEESVIGENSRTVPEEAGQEEQFPSGTPAESEEDGVDSFRARPAEVQSRYSWFMLRKQMSEEETRVRGNKSLRRLLTHRSPAPLAQQAEDVSPQNEVDEDTECGIGSWRPPWLQCCLSKKYVVLAHGLTGMCYGILASYFNASISTLEKQFKIPSRISGLISCGWDIGTLASVWAMGYFGARWSKPRMVALGSLLVATSCVVRLLPQLLYGPGQDALLLTKEYSGGTLSLGNISAAQSGAPSLCGAAWTSDDCAQTNARTAGYISAGLMFLAHCIQGVGSSVYWTLGLSYLDDNTSKNKAPIAHASSQLFRMLGPTFGYTLAFYTLSKYVDPTLTPRIDKNDPRWIGAWWLGWGPLACIMVLMAGAMALFPRQLPRTALRRAQRPRSETREAAISKNFFRAFHHLLKNKILLCNTLSAVFFFFGNAGYWIFFPKYMETLYHQSSSSASLITGSIGLVSAALGLLASGIVISRFKPRARYLAAWCVIVEIIEALCKFSWMFLSCGERLLQGSWAPNGSWNLTTECNLDCGCGPDVKYSPVCSLEGDAVFYSPCHAGCGSATELLNGTKIFNNCSCILSGVAVDGPCAMNCVTNFSIFLASQVVICFLAASGRAGNVIIAFRCVHEDDKSLAIAFGEFLLAGLAFIPAPIVYGMLLDYTCLVWGKTCGKTGNCWLYDDEKLRYMMNLTGSSLMLVGVLFDAGVWYHSKDLKIYDEDDNNETEPVNGSVLNNTS